MIPKTANLYFVASPLQYLAARVIAKNLEAGGAQILIWYKPGVEAVVIPEDWDNVAYMPWPRLEPLPGFLGRHRRLLENIDMVSSLVGTCEILNIHSAVFDTEAINYFLRALPKVCGAREMHARILPDGIISIRRYPLSIFKQFLQCLKKVRLLLDSRLNYWCFSGDRLGTDAKFCDRVYVVAGLPHEYPSEKTVVLPPLVNKISQCGDKSIKTALVIGQPLAGAGLVDKSNLALISQEIFEWLTKQGFERIEYKRHPKDENCELIQDQYICLSLDEPLETWMSKKYYDAVVGVRSSALLFAKQIYSEKTQVVAFGWNHIKFKSKSEYDDMRSVFIDSGITIL